MAVVGRIDVMVEDLDFSITGMDFEPRAGTFGGEVEYEGVDLVGCS